MTSRQGGRLGPLGRRLLVAFVLVALVSVIVVTVAALIGTVRGLDAGESQQRQLAAESAADAAGAAYATAGGWTGADLGAAASIAAANDAELLVRDDSGVVVASTGSGMGMGGMGGLGRGGVTADVIVDGTLVGSVRLGFGTPATSQGQSIAWTWILVAAVVAVVIAFGAAVATSRWLTAPLHRLADVARSFAAGERAVRPDPADLGSATEIGDLARAFDAAAADVERSEAARRRLSADVAHELRTPLAALQAGLEEMADGLVQPDETTLAGLHAQALRLGRIVDDLALLSAAETASFDLRRQRLDLRALVEQAVAAARPSCEVHGIVLNGVRQDGDVTPAWVDGDPDRLHQAVGNLLSNAARYCRPGDRVDVTVSTDEAHAIVTVSDTGPGIAPDDLPRVFDRMWRGSVPASGSGSGIGLAVVRALVTAHGGTVEASSDGRSGASFTIRLPRERG